MKDVIFGIGNLAAWWAVGYGLQMAAGMVALIPGRRTSASP